MKKVTEELEVSEKDKRKKVPEKRDETGNRGFGLKTNILKLWSIFLVRLVFGKK